MGNQNQNQNLESRLQTLLNDLEDAPYKVGQTYFFRCVTFHYIGKIVRLGLFEIVLEAEDGVVWVADSGKFQEAIEKGSLSDYMHYPKGAPCILGRFNIVDATPWNVPMPPRKNS